MTANDENDVPMINTNDQQGFRTPSPPRRLSSIPPPPLLVRMTRDGPDRFRRPQGLSRRALLHRMPPLILTSACTEDTPLPKPQQPVLDEAPLLPRGPLVSPQRVSSARPMAQQAYDMAYARVQNMLWDEVRKNVDAGSTEFIAIVPKSFAQRGVASQLENAGYIVTSLGDHNHSRVYTLVLTRLRVSWDMFVMSNDLSQEL